MNEAAPGIRRLCIAIATDGPAAPGGGPPRRASLGAVLDEACAAAEVRRTHWVLLPDGCELGCFPPGIDEGRVVAAFTRELRRAVTVANDLHAADLHAADLGAAVRLRLRVALHQGITRCDERGYRGRAVVKTCRLRDADVLRRELAAHPESDLAFIVSAELFDDVADDVDVADVVDVTRDVAGRGHSDLRRSEFRRVTVPAPAPMPGFVAWVSTPRSPASVGLG